ncbi:MAG: hypothetical protein U1E17_12725 [Geminicoccaceae bacterium]
MAGETCGLPPDEAKLLCLAIYGTCVDPENNEAARRRGSRAMRFDRPTRLKLKRDLRRAEGIFSVAGSVHEFDSWSSKPAGQPGLGEEVEMTTALIASAPSSPGLPACPPTPGRARRRSPAATCRKMAASTRS